MDSIFLEAVVETAKSARIKFEKAVSYVEDINRRSVKIKGSQENVRRILDSFYENPIQESSELVLKLGISRATINRIISSMLQEGYIVETSGSSRNRIYTMEPYLDIFR